MFTADGQLRLPGGVPVYGDEGTVTSQGVVWHCTIKMHPVLPTCFIPLQKPVKKLVTACGSVLKRIRVSGFMPEVGNVCLSG